MSTDAVFAATATATATRPSRVTTGRPRSTVTSAPRLSLTRPLLETEPAARRAPFVVLVLCLIGAGLIALLILNTAIAADSFTRRSLNADIEKLQLQEQELQLAVSAAQAPSALAEAATDLGMIPAGTPGFLVVHPDGSTEVVGAATPAAVPAPPSAAGGANQPAQPPPGDPPAAPEGNG